MPYYYPLKRLKATELRRTAEGLARLRAAFLAPQVPGIAPIPARTFANRVAKYSWAGWSRVADSALSTA